MRDNSARVDNLQCRTAGLAERLTGVGQPDFTVVAVEKLDADVLLEVEDLAVTAGWARWSRCAARPKFNSAATAMNARIHRISIPQASPIRRPEADQPA